MNAAFKTACLAALAVLALSGCGKSFCEDQSTSWTNTLEVKLKDCPLMAQTAKTAMAPKTGQACEDAYAKCSADDKKKMDEALLCNKNLPTCVAGKENEWATAGLECQAKLPAAGGTCNLY